MNQYETHCYDCKATLTEMTNIYIWQGPRDGIEQVICEDCNQDGEDDRRAQGWKEVGDDD